MRSPSQPTPPHRDEVDSVILDTFHNVSDIHDLNAEATVPQRSFQKKSIRNLNYSGHSFLPKTDFQESDCTNTSFIQCQIPQANFQNAVVGGSNFTSANLAHARFDSCKSVPPADTNRLTSLITQFLPTRSNPKTTTFDHANLHQASFKNADCRGWSFRNADLTNADFENARLQNTDLTGAKLDGIQLKGAQLKGAFIDISKTIEKEMAKSNGKDGKVAKKAIELAEMCANHDINLGLDEIAHDDIKELFQEAQFQNVNREKLEAHFRKSYQRLEKKCNYADLFPEEYLPYIFQNILNKLAFSTKEPTPGRQRTPSNSSAESFEPSDIP